MLKIYLIKFNIKLQSLQNSRDSKIFKEINIFERIIINVKIISLIYHKSIVLITRQLIVG